LLDKVDKLEVIKAQMLGLYSSIPRQFCALSKNLYGPIPFPRCVSDRKFVPFSITTHGMALEK
jgi:hypothetical protein